MRAPSASSRSAEPDLLVAERLPCFATQHPAPAATKAAVVETLNVGTPPPVPAVSSRSVRSASTGTASSRIVRARPVSSSTVSPFARSATRKAAVWASPTSPAMISASTSCACSALRSVPEATASMARVRTSFGISDRFARRAASPSAALQEVGEDALARSGQHRLGVELHALRRQGTVPDRHHGVARPRRHSSSCGRSGSTTSEW